MKYIVEADYITALRYLISRFGIGKGRQKFKETKKRNGYCIFTVSQGWKHSAETLARDIVAGFSYVTGKYNKAPPKFGEGHFVLVDKALKKDYPIEHSN